MVNKLDEKIMRFMIKSLKFLLLFLFISSCAVLPKTINENNIIVVANFKWIGKMGKMVIAEGPATPILKNVNTGKTYSPDYHDKSYTYFYRLEKGTYMIDEIVLNAGSVKLHLKTSDKTRPFEIIKNGAHFIGGLDIVDYQLRMDYHMHDSIQHKEDLAKIKKLLITQTGFSSSSEIEYIKDVIIEDKW